ncbi:hypothetical protein L198_07279 [Cryptococcus wingfieldii CBS 7118]|uniref:Uncharacterized protein n=1 Tax=Cryptococcus wingfieldii CBS 7118 TaxID=1295528 RepID=A0A1E3IDT0_9TREE|nr:hypothetical protein L198_07279 [Cryptococcus wingfieldii CBS 7118]ODN86585.1 hypothetical protein L198_07279 [Cryptococcus wingfieldii CBS 7118]
MTSVIMNNNNNCEEEFLPSYEPHGFDDSSSVYVDYVGYEDYEDESDDESEQTARNVPNGLILTCVQNGNWFLGSHFSAAHTHIYVCRNPSSISPAARSTVASLASILELAYQPSLHESPMWVAGKLEDDIKWLKGSIDKFRGFTHIRFKDRKAYYKAVQAVKAAAGTCRSPKDREVEMIFPGGVRVEA